MFNKTPARFKTNINAVLVLKKFAQRIEHLRFRVKRADEKQNDINTFLQTQVKLRL